MNTSYFIIDFDSTFTKVEALEELVDICCEGEDAKKQAYERIKQITDASMAGEYDFFRSLSERLSLLNIEQKHLDLVAHRLKSKVSLSIERNKRFFKENTERIYLISSGFKEIILPVVLPFGIKAENVYANTFCFDPNGKVIGFDQENPLCRNMGKVAVLQSLKLKGKVSMIGDGYNDYETKLAGVVDEFIAFTENVFRENVVEHADHVAPSLEEILYINNLPMNISYPKNRINVLLLENIHPSAVETFLKEGYKVETVKGALDEDELSERIKEVSILGIRSKTQLTAKVLENAKRLLSVGAFCIGTNQIDLSACTQKSVVVFNAPYSNTRSVVELSIGSIILLMRNIIDKSADLHKGIWTKSAENSFEVRGKKLGIVGYGNIGSQLSVVAEAIGMEVYYYDLVDKLAHGNAKKCASLDELLALADIVSLHVDGRKENSCLMGPEQFAKMKQGSYFLNLSRGSVVDIEALKSAIESKKVLGAAVDVFPYEPKDNQERFVSPLCGLPNTILTPHIGGSTLEAQENIAQFVPRRIIEYINSGDTYGSVNFPNVKLPEFSEAHRLLHIHRNVPGIIAQINNVLASNEVNIVGQYLKTNEQIGYVITDINTAYNDKIVDELKKIPNTLKFRILY